MSLTAMLTAGTTPDVLLPNCPKDVMNVNVSTLDCACTQANISTKTLTVWRNIVRRALNVTYYACCALDSSFICLTKKIDLRYFITCTPQCLYGYIIIGNTNLKILPPFLKPETVLLSSYSMLELQSR